MNCQVSSKLGYVHDVAGVKRMVSFYEENGAPAEVEHGPMISETTGIVIARVGQSGSQLLPEEYWAIYRDGKERIYATYFETPEIAVDQMFPLYLWPGGYPAPVVGDGYMICAGCARKAWNDPDSSDWEPLHSGEMHAVSGDGDNRGTGETCDSCGEYIPGMEPCCAECGTNESDDSFHSPVFVKESGDAQICAKCLAEMIAPPERYDYTSGEYRKGDPTARKVGKGLYEVDLNGPWYGGGTYRAH